MKQRVLSAFAVMGVIGAIVILSLFFPICIDLFVSLVCALAVFEFCKAIRTLKMVPISFPSMAFAFVYPMLSVFGVSYLICYVYTIIMLSVIVFCHSKISFKDFAYTFSMTVIITVSLTSIVKLKQIDVTHSTMFLVMSMATPWLNDAGAYFVGVLAGKHKLCPKISPKKTIEGAVGGVVVCVITSGIAYFLFEWLIYSDLRINYVNAAVITFAGALLSIVGDLSFSVIKRSYAVKDYGDLIPGHGGILDRFDSVVFFAPFLYIISEYLPIVVK